MSALKPCRSAQRRYMRSSMSAQSCASVPPAPGVQGDDGVARVVLAAQLPLELHARERSLGVAEGSQGFLACVVVTLGGQLREHRGVGDGLELTPPRGERREQVGALFQDFLCPVVVGPELRRGGLGVEGG